jgi:acetate---CoA ligase (ADP-forming)
VLSRSLFAPKSIAVVGASPKPSSLGRSLLGALRTHGFPGDLAAINPNYTNIDGVVSYPSFGDVPFSVDLALLFVPAAAIEETIIAAGAAGVDSAIVFSSGFAETGDGGTFAQTRLAQACRDAGVRVLGPNCQGIVDFRSGLTATFSPSVLAADRSALAPIAYLGQSGAIGGVFFDRARHRGRTPTAWVSTGNEMDLSAVEIASEFAASADFDLLCLYLERVPAGDAWFDLLDAADGTSTRIALLRSGRSEAGRQAAASHTGALTGNDAAFEASCIDAGVLVVDDVNDFDELAVSVRRRRPRARRGVGVVTTSGGAGGLAADHLARAGLAVPKLSDATTKRLRSLLPAFAGLNNPVDVTAELMMRRPQDLRAVSATLLEDPAVDEVLLVLTNVVGEMAQTVADAFADADGPPLSIAYLAAPDQITNAVQQLQRQGIAVHDSLTAAVRAMELRRRTQRPAPRPDTVGFATSGRVGAPPEVISPTEWGATPLLDWAGVPRPAAVLTNSPDEAAEAAERFSGPVVLKVQSSQVLHKSGHGAVRVNVATPEVAEAAAQMLRDVHASVPDAQIEGLLVQELAPPGIELLVGVRAGVAGYPATVTVGIGGTAVEIYRDVATTFAPVTASQAEQLLLSLRGAALLLGDRGAPRADVASAADAVSRLSALASVPRIIEVEVNPLIVLPEGAGVVAVDLLVRQSCSDAAASQATSGSSIPPSSSEEEV